jgi:ketosteroid isomerase-like protein
MEQIMIADTYQPVQIAHELAPQPLFGADLVLPSQGTVQASAPSVRNKAIVEASFDAWAAGNGGPYELLDENCSWTIEGHSLAAGTYPSREAFMREVIRPFNARMLIPLRPGTRRFYADGDTVVVHFKAHGVARGGRPYDNTYAWLLRLSGGRIIRANAFFDAVKFNELWTRVKPASE